MIKKKSANKTKPSKKETIISEIIPVLTASLIILKEKLGEKKFEKRIKKAAKLLTSGIKPIKKPAAKKKALKKAPKRVNAKSLSTKTAKTPVQK